MFSSKQRYHETHLSTAWKSQASGKPSCNKRFGVGWRAIWIITLEKKLDWKYFVFSQIVAWLVLRASSSRFAENLLCLSLPCQVQLANLQVEFVWNLIFFNPLYAPDKCNTSSVKRFLEGMIVSQNKKLKKNCQKKRNFITKF